MKIDWSQFSLIAFIDSNVALECLALDQLPWTELQKTGTILALVVPAVLKEVESKKNNARLGDHARRFNKLLRPLLQDRETVVIRESPAPRVEIAIANVPKIDWAEFPDFDEDEPDARVALQALLAAGPEPEKRLLVSHDIRPLQLARQCGLKVLQIGDNWLRPKEVSEAEKKNAALQKEIAAIKNRETKLEVSISADRQQVDSILVSEIPKDERQNIESTIFHLTPYPEAPRIRPLLGSLGRDYSFDERYEKWQKEIIPRFVSEYERKIEMNFGQVELCLRLSNVGMVPAESLLIHLVADGGWLNEKFVMASPRGPSAPRRRHAPLVPEAYFDRVRIVPPPKLHDFELLVAPRRTRELQIACRDFRQNFEYKYPFVAWLDPRADSFAITAIATASNLHGEVRVRLEIQKSVRTKNVYDLIDPGSLHFRSLPDSAQRLSSTPKSERSKKFEFDGSDWER